MKKYVNQKIIVSLLAAILAFQSVGIEKIWANLTSLSISDSKQLNTGDEVYGFKITKIEKAKSINSDAITFNHVKTGAELVWFKNDDEKLSIYTGFNTKPIDDKGTAHIFEHLVFGGSEKYPFTNMMWDVGASHNALNAMVSYTGTYYETQGYKQEAMQVAMDFWLESVFGRNNDKFVAQGLAKDGHRLVLENLESPLVRTGVVFNEVKFYTGTFNPFLLLIRANQALFPDTPLIYNAGGEPTEIKNLNFEDIISFRDNNYVPSNNRTIIYGKYDYEAFLKYLNEKYSQFDLPGTVAKFEKQKPFSEIVVKEYPELTANDRDIHIYAIAGKDLWNKEYDMTLDSVVSYLNQNDDFTGSLIEKFGQPVEFFNLASNGMSPQSGILFYSDSEAIKDSQHFKKMITETIEEFLKRGINKEDSDIFFDNRIFNANTNRDIFNSLSIDYVQYSSPTLAFNEADIYKKFKATDKFLENNIKDLILNNNHAALLTFKYTPGLQEKRLQEEQKELQDLKESMTKEQLQKIIEHNKAIEEFDANNQNIEDFLKKSNLSYEEIKKMGVNFIDYKESKIDGNITIINANDKNTSDILSNQTYFDASSVPVEDENYLTLMGHLLSFSDLEVGNLEREEMQKSSRKFRTSFDYTLINTSKIGQDFKPYIKITADTIADEFEKASKYLNDVIKNVSFTPEQIKKSVPVMLEMLAAEKLQKREEAKVLEIASTYLNKKKAFSAVQSNKFENFLRNLNFEEASKKINHISKEVFKKDNSLVVISGDTDKNDLIVGKSVQLLFEGLAEKPTKKYNSYADKISVKPQQYVEASQISNSNYLQVLKFEKVGNIDEIVAKYEIAIKLLERDFTYIVRSINGAYTTVLGVNSEGLLIGALRDLDFSKTKKVVDALPQKMAEIKNVSDKEFKEAQIAAAIKYVSKNADFKENLTDQIEKYYFTKTTKQDIERNFKNLFSYKKEDIASLYIELEKMLKEDNFVVFAPKSILDANKNLLKK